MPDLFSRQKTVLAILAHKKEKIWHIQDKCRKETCTVIILLPGETAEKTVLAILAHKKEKIWHIQDKCRKETCTVIILLPGETAVWQTLGCS